MADDHPASTATTGVVSVGGSVTGNLESTGDNDWIRVTLAAGRLYQFDLEGADSGQGTLADPTLVLLDNGGGYISTDYDSGTGNNARIIYTPSASGTYYLSAYAIGSQLGTYKLSATDLSGPRPHWIATSDIGTHPAGWLLLSAADFNRDSTNDVLWFNPSNGDVDLWKISNAQWAGSIDIGTHPAGYNPIGNGDYNRDGTPDIFWYNPTSGDVDIWKIQNGQWAGSSNVGAHPLGAQPRGPGDFNGDRTADVLWYNASTNDAEV